MVPSSALLSKLDHEEPPRVQGRVALGAIIIHKLLGKGFSEAKFQQFCDSVVTRHCRTALTPPRLLVHLLANHCDEITMHP